MPRLRRLRRHGGPPCLGRSAWNVIWMCRQRRVLWRGWSPSLVARAARFPPQIPRIIALESWYARYMPIDDVSAVHSLNRCSGSVYVASLCLPVTTDATRLILRTPPVSPELIERRCGEWVRRQSSDDFWLGGNVVCARERCVHHVGRRLDAGRQDMCRALLRGDQLGHLAQACHGIRTRATEATHVWDDPVCGDLDASNTFAGVNRRL